ncbi:glycine cleavage system protein GcvH [Atopobacter sp. AH10]|uniref:glycine cleavage system protein GcvH n=1 Tax=Atopobacter sp. AH10 TaxID=2315861 RepID=UPI000EF26078|nr:glycine cleavage system protein GcvH [Atopobacter sp. AH10]RLK63367.1 glycine cleavage system protein GcvH [Atopobacter sp. AH10]
MADKENLFYTEDHEWIEVLEDNKFRIGITDHAAEQLGDVVYIELPEVDDELDADEDVASVESVKSVSDVNVPFAGTVVEVNEALEDEPELVSNEPFEGGWLAVIKAEEAIDTSELMNADQYADHIAE